MQADGRTATVALVSLGCKLNQAEGEAVVDLFVQDGYARVDRRSEAGVTLVNTCAVTSRAAFQSRQALRRSLRRNPHGLVLATGCYAQLAPSEVASVGAHLVVGNSVKERIPALVERQLAGDMPQAVLVEDPDTWSGFLQHVPARFGLHTRAFLKVQEGCDLSCTFCIVRKARGRSRSLAPAHVPVAARKLVAGGHREIVLSGVNLASYGRDLTPRIDLGSLLTLLSGIEGLARIRLGSLEPQDVDRRLLGAATGTGKFCPHFHLPLQSGSPRTLRRMGRRYDPALYRRVVDRILTLWPRAAIGADVIAGFPGETGTDFEQTVRLVEDLPFAYLHVFPYSPRSGTPAEALEPSVAPSVRTERAALLRDLAAAKQRAFARAQVGTTVEVLLERPFGDNRWEGLTRNYLRVAVTAPDLGNGALAVVRVTAAEGGVASGCLVSAS